MEASRKVDKKRMHLQRIQADRPKTQNITNLSRDNSRSIRPARNLRNRNRRIVARLRRNENQALVAKRYGLTRSRISQMRYENGLPAYPTVNLHDPLAASKRRQKARKMRLQLIPPKEIARVIKVAESTIVKYLNGLNPNPTPQILFNHIIRERRKLEGFIKRHDGQLPKHSEFARSSHSYYMYGYNLGFSFPEMISMLGHHVRYIPKKVKPAGYWNSKKGLEAARKEFKSFIKKKGREPDSKEFIRMFNSLIKAQAKSKIDTATIKLILRL